MDPPMACQNIYTKHEGINVYHPVIYSPEYLNLNIINIYTVVIRLII